VAGGAVCGSQLSNVLNDVLQVLYQLDAQVMLWDVCCLLCCAAGVDRYATLPNIMKAKKKPISSTTPQQLGVTIENQLSTKKVSGHACCMSLQPCWEVAGPTSSSIKCRQANESILCDMFCLFVYQAEVRFA